MQMPACAVGVGWGGVVGIINHRLSTVINALTQWQTVFIGSPVGVHRQPVPGWWDHIQQQVLIQHEGGLSELEMQKSMSGRPVCRQRNAALPTHQPHFMVGKSLRPLLLALPLRGGP